MSFFGDTWGKLQVKLMSADERLRRGRCPDCGGRLLAGPEGGAGQNALCEDCKEEFVIVPGFGNQMLQRRGKASPQRQRQVYGVENG